MFVGYLDYFRSRVISKIEGLPESALRESRLPSGGTPVELLKHLTYVELWWFDWGARFHPMSPCWIPQPRSTGEVFAGGPVTFLIVCTR